jgi:uncharacterized protein
VDIAKLFELQKLDVNLEKARRKLLQLKQTLGESEEVAAARAEVRSTEAELHRWHAAQKDAELGSQSLAGNIAAKETELMSGRVTHPKELESLQANVDSLRRQRSALEDSGVEALVQVETLSKQLAAQQASLAKVEEKWKSGQSELIQEENRYKRIYAQIQQQRDAAAQGLPAADLAFYEQLRSRKAGIAVAPLKNSECGVCHIQVPTGVASALRSRKDEAVLCPSCGRVLFSA